MMIGWAATFLIIALIAAVLGFGGVAIISVEIAEVIFFLAIVLFLIAAIFGFLRGRSAPMPEEPVPARIVRLVCRRQPVSLRGS
jgi:uncharacterized membrane protein YtjA (UPF0391 family)